MELDNLRIAIKNIGIDAAKLIIEELVINGKVASGDLINSISPEYVVEFKNFAAKIDVFGSYYFAFTEHGRNKGTPPSLDILRQWCEHKGIDQRAAYPIQEKIRMFGVDASPSLEEVINNLNIDAMKSELETALKIDIETEIEKILKG